MIKVSVCTVTYNHEQYIAQAIESVLAQRGPDLEIEMVIGEDVSSDGTRRIIAEYARRYPKNIKPLFHEKNLGPGTNSRACLDACTGEFIAALEGDDYWTDPNKLRLQVAALQARPDCAFCFHDAEAAFDNDLSTAWTFGERFRQILPTADEPWKSYSQLDLARLGWFIPTASMLFRINSLPKPIPVWFDEVFSGDFTLQMLSAQNGDALYLPYIMSHYRLHAGSVMETSKNTLEQNSKRIFEAKQYKRIFSKAVSQHFDIKLEHLYFKHSEMLGETGSEIGKTYYYIKAISVNLGRFIFHMRRILERLF